VRSGAGVLALEVVAAGAGTSGLVVPVEVGFGVVLPDEALLCQVQLPGTLIRLVKATLVLDRTANLPGDV
jgi:hypothetical protein